MIHFSEMNEIQKDFFKQIFKVSLMIGRDIAFSVASENLPDHEILLEFIENKNLALVVARKLFYEPNVSVKKTLKEFVKLLDEKLM